MIRHEVLVTSPLTVTAARGSILLWCQTMGYRLTSPPFLSSVAVERGSWVGNVGSLNPKTWRSQIQATFRPLENGCEVTLEWLVTTLGQVGTKADIHFWTYEVQKTLESALGGMPDIREYTRQAGKAQLGNTWRALIFTASLLVPLIGVWVATESGVYGIAAAAVLGTATWFVFRVPRKLPEIAAPASPPPLLLEPSPAPPPLRNVDADRALD
jgi:hypothetical protein